MGGSATVFGGPFSQSGQADTAQQSESKWRAIFGGGLPDGVIKTGNALDENPSGSTGGKLLVSANGSGMQVFVNEGRAIVRGFLVENRATQTLSVDPAPTATGQSRVDLVVAGISITTGTPYLAVITGTPSGAPVAPLPTRTASVWEVPLAWITVGNSVLNISGVGSTVVDNRQYQTNTSGVNGTSDITLLSTAGTVQVPIGASGPVMQFPLVTDGRPVEVHTSSTVAIQTEGQIAFLAINVAQQVTSTTVPAGTDYPVGQCTQMGAIQGSMMFAKSFLFDGSGIGLPLLAAGRWIFTLKLTVAASGSTILRADRSLHAKEIK